MITGNLEDIEFKFQQMRSVGALTGECLRLLHDEIKPGITTADIEKFVRNFAKKHNLRCATQGYKGFPGDCCTSLNEVACHGIPCRTDYLNKGSIISVDVTFINEAGYHGDSCVTYEVGKVDIKYADLIYVARQAMWAGIKAAVPGNKVMDIGEAIVDYLKPFKMKNVLETYCGHGIGKQFHMFPLIPHHIDKKLPDSHLVLEPGMTFTIEPIITLGKTKTKILKDNWAVRTKDRQWTAQFEHTIGITKDGNEVFTR